MMHGFGVLGSEGRGVCNHFELTDEVDVICASFSKSLAGSGGFVASNQDAIDYMRSHSKQTIFQLLSHLLHVLPQKKHFVYYRVSLNIERDFSKISSDTVLF